MNTQSTQNTESRQCQAICKNGEQCKNNIKCKIESFCGRHKNNVQQNVPKSEPSSEINPEPIFIMTTNYESPEDSDKDSPVNISVIPLPQDPEKTSSPSQVKSFLPEKTPDIPQETSILQEKVLNLSKLVQPEQRSKEWYEARNTRITASDGATCLTVKQDDIEKHENKVFELKKTTLGTCCNPYSNKKEFIRKKCGLDTFKGNAATRWGQKYEQVATQIYEKRNNVDVIEFGLLLHPTIPIIGASPDGITKDGVMLEIKCPMVRTITGVPLNYYWIQMQLQLEVCDLDICDFEECSFSEYANEKEYLEDVFTNDSGEVVPNMCCMGLEKGIIIEITDENGEVSYYYPKLGESPDSIEKEISEWVKEQDIEDWIFGKKKARRIYWRLENYSCVVVKRDKEWFSSRLPEMESVWKEVLHYREVGIDKLPKQERKSTYSSGGVVSITTNTTNKASTFYQPRKRGQGYTQCLLSDSESN